jgi:RNA polymerase sigma factor (sigma-70 family)
VEASTLAHAGRRGLLARRSPLVKLQGDEKLIAMIREGQTWAFEALFDRYQSRLLAFCRHMLPSEQDAEDVLQDVFVSAHKALLKDNRPIKVKPWLYRIARNRCLNHLRRPVPEGSDELMDEHPHNGGATTADQVQTRAELREVLVDVKHLPETQRTALLLREVDALSYSEIAVAMDTTVPAVKSLLVRARITLAESSQARLLTCGEVQLELAEAAEGLTKATGPVRQHVKGCEQCKDFRDQLRSNSKALAAILPIGPLALFKDAVLAKLGGAGAGGATSGGAGAGGSAASGACAAGGATAAGGSATAAGGAIGGAAAATGGGSALGGGIGAIGGVIGTKAVATAATAAVVAAGAVEVKNYVASEQPVERNAIVAEAPANPEPQVVRAVEPDPVVVPVSPPTSEPAKAEDAAPAPPAGDPPTEPSEPAPPADPAPAAAPAATPLENPAPDADESSDGAEIGSATAHERPPETSGTATATPTHDGPVTTEPAPSDGDESLAPALPGAEPGVPPSDDGRVPVAPVESSA